MAEHAVPAQRRPVRMCKAREEKKEEMKRKIASLTEARAEWDTSNCSSVIIGRAASETGYVIAAHNEDDKHGVAAVYQVPRKHHAPGEVVVFDDGKARIPEVPETYAYSWTEIRTEAGLAFGDTFVNEKGVSVFSNSCNPCKDRDDESLGGDVGYGLRKLAAERAGSAREGMEIIVSLVEQYGYYSSRCYCVCDKDEAWIIQIPRGHVAAARRIPDDEVFFIPNWFTIRQIDFSDVAHREWYWSEDLVPHAIERGYYVPARDGDYSDFDFAKAYQDGDGRRDSWERANAAWPLLLGRKPEDNKQVSYKPARKLGLADCKRVLRDHFEGQPYCITEGGRKSPHVDAHFCLCNSSTVESTVILFDEDPALTIVCRAMPRPCILPYVPWFLGVRSFPDGYSWRTWEEAERTHFHTTAEDFRNDPRRAWSQFRALLYLTDADYAGNHETAAADAAAAEAVWQEQAEALKARCREMHGTAEGEELKALLTAFTKEKAAEAVRWAQDEFYKIGEAELDRIMDRKEE